MESRMEFTEATLHAPEVRGRGLNFVAMLLSGKGNYAGEIASA
jgi:hypothetical protein